MIGYKVGWRSAGAPVTTESRWVKKKGAAGIYRAPTSKKATQCGTYFIGQMEGGQSTATDAIPEAGSGDNR